MPRSPRFLLSILALLGLAFATGCAAPCDRYCDIKADYIEFCLESGSQAAWADASDWTTWDFADKEGYVSSCQSDLEDQLDGADSSAAISRGCEDDANRYLELAERGLCADLP
jgi:hypothetical protein